MEVHQLKAPDTSRTPVRSDSLSKINDNVKSILAKKIANHHTRNNSTMDAKHLTYVSNNNHKAVKLEPSLTLIPNSENTSNFSSGIPNNNVIVNHNNSCFNNINIYTNNNSKPSDLNLKQYILNKMNKNKAVSKNAQLRANSATNY